MHNVLYNKAMFGMSLSWLGEILMNSKKVCYEILQNRIL